MGSAAGLSVFFLDREQLMKLEIPGINK